MDVVTALHRAREAYERREWLTAYKTLSDLDDTALTATDFITLADTAELLGHSNDAIQALQRAHHSAIAANEPSVAIRNSSLSNALHCVGNRGSRRLASQWRTPTRRYWRTTSNMATCWQHACRALRPQNGSAGPTKDY